MGISPTAPAPTEYFANWTCNNQPGCIADLGHNVGSAGPFCTVAACMKWEQTYILGTCDGQPNYPIYNGPPPGTCAN